MIKFVIWVFDYITHDLVRMCGDRRRRLSGVKSVFETVLYSKTFSFESCAKTQLSCRPHCQHVRGKENVLGQNCLPLSVNVYTKFQHLLFDSELSENTEHVHSRWREKDPYDTDSREQQWSVLICRCSYPTRLRNKSIFMQIFKNIFTKLKCYL